MEMNPTKGVPPILVRQMDPDRDPDRCAWWYTCREPAWADVTHPTLGDVPICRWHLKWLEGEDEL